MKFTKNLLFIWLILLFLVTFSCSLTYLGIQQSLRLGTNELPAQVTIDTALNLQQGKSPELSIPTNKVDISRSTDTFVMIFDKNKNLVATSGMMGKSKPSYPKGVLDYVAKKGEDRVTWQTNTGLRFATVATKTNTGYIVGARSLSETEKLIDHISQLIGYSWIAYVICSTIALVIVSAILKKN